MVKVIDAIDKCQLDIELDQAGYFIIKVNHMEQYIEAHFHNYDKELLSTIRGRDARSIYWTMIENKMVSTMSHAAYLGKELMRAEHACKAGTNYQQE